MRFIDKLDKIKELKIEDIIGAYMMLTPEGTNFKGICPFHAATKPTLIINPEKKIFKCFTCGSGGDGLTFVKEFRSLTFI